MYAHPRNRTYIPIWRPLGMLVTLGLALSPVTVLAQEEVPTGDAAAAEQAAACEQFQDPPLSALTVDARHRDPESGQLISDDELPFDCWAAHSTPGGVLFIGGSCGCSCDLSHHVLQLARFCHRPLRFEDVELERCGRSRCCPPLHAATHFTRDVFLLPLRVAFTKPGTCVRTPTPTVCQPLGATIDYRVPAATWSP